MSSASHLPIQYWPTKPFITDIYRKRMVMMMITTHADWFRRDDLTWVSKNYHIWEAFEREADLIWNNGRRHYSARTIIEFLRHETAIKEKSADGWKINDHATPSLARLYMLMHPDRSSFFERRPGGSGTRVQ